MVNILQVCFFFLSSVSEMSSRGPRGKALLPPIGDLELAREAEISLVGITRCQSRLNTAKTGFFRRHNRESGADGTQEGPVRPGSISGQGAPKAKIKGRETDSVVRLDSSVCGG